MSVPRMVRVRQTFARPCVPDIPRAVADALAGAGLPVKRGDTVAVGAGSRGIANIDVVVGATVRYLRDLGARPFVFPAVGREMLAKAPIGFGLGIVENGYDETGHIEAFNAAELEQGERRLLKDAREWMARLPFSPIDVLIVEHIGKNISGSGMDTNVIGRPSNPHEPFPADPKILWIVALDLTGESYGNATGIGNADFTTRRLVDKIDMKPTLINAITACAPNGAKVPPTYDTDREAIETALSCVGLTPPEKARVIRIKNTLMLGEIEVSEAFLSDVAKRTDLTVLGDPAELRFDVAGVLRGL